MIFVAELLLYLLFVVGILLGVAVRLAVARRLTAGCWAALYGLLASLFGFILPFALFAVAGLGFYRDAAPTSLSGDIGTFLLGVLVLCGPLVGAPVAFLCVVLWDVRRRP